jgi:prepilin signal peptidase PulO-like enzyme (type II secretory pathway)
MLAILSFLYGASVGSFVQVVVSRLHVAPITKSRSKCLSCGETLRPLDLIPLLSFIWLRGKCRYCKTDYGNSALIVETLFGLSFLSLYYFVLTGHSSLLVSFSWLVFYTFLFGVLGAMALYDNKHSYIPLSFIAAFLFLCLIMFGIRSHEYLNLLTLLAPFFVAAPFFIIWLVTKGKGVGFGDIVLFFGVGAFFGALQGFAVFILSVWFGAVYGVLYKYCFSKRKTVGGTPIPFVPFIVAAFILVLFTGIDIFSIALLFS